jgi:peroxiredoxin-like protein
MIESPALYYETEIEWKGEKDGRLRGRDLPPISVSAPPEFKGREGQWTPEHLLVASVNACFMLTFLATAEHSKLTPISFSSRAKGRLDKVEGAGYQITEIILKPTIVITSAHDLARMPRLLEKAKENCFVTNSIKSVVKIEPEIFCRETQTSPCPPIDATAPATSEAKIS